MWVTNNKVWYSEEEYKELEQKHNQVQRQYNAVVKQDINLQKELRIKNEKLVKINRIANKLKTKEDYKNLEEVENDINQILKECEE